MNVLIGLLSSLLVLAGFFMWCINMPGRSLQDVPPLTGEQQQLSDRLHRHVAVLAGEIGARHAGDMPALNRAADYIEDRLRDFGYTPHSDEFAGGRYRNIIAELRGGEKRKEIIVVGAHYDTRPVTPGADDNASGVAALLELARALHGTQFARTVRLIGFTNEEVPFYGTDLMGSRVNAGRARARDDNIVAMFSLEMIGYYSDAPAGQRYPALIRPFYPERGDFLAFVSDLASRGLLRQSIAHFRESSVFPSEGMAAPAWLVPDVRRSDNAAYRDHGYPAVMITDTSNFRNPNYHTPADTPATLDYPALARAVAGLTAMVEALAGNHRFQGP